MKNIVLGIIAALFTYFAIIPIALPGEIDLTNIDHLFMFLFIMILFSALLTKFLNSTFNFK